MKHRPDCPLLRAVKCAVPIECEHGYDVCPQCDPCTCQDGTIEITEEKDLWAFVGTPRQASNVFDDLFEYGAVLNRGEIVIKEEVDG